MTSKALIALAVLAVLAGTASSQAAAQEPDPLQTMCGNWKAMVSFMGSGGRFTVSLAEEAEIERTDPSSIAFSLQPVAASHPLFEVLLTSTATERNYLLSVKTDGARTLENVPLSYDEGSFSGDGTLTGTAGEAHAVKVTIAPTPKDGYEWKVLDAGAPSGNDIVLAFSFFERLDEEATAQGRSAPSRELDSDTASVDGGSVEGVELRGAATIKVSMSFNSEGKMSLDRMWMEIQDAGEPTSLEILRESRFLDPQGREIALEDLPSDLEVRVRARERGGKRYAEVVTVLNAPGEGQE